MRAALVDPVPTRAASPVGAGAARLLVLWCVALAVWWGFAFWPTPPGDTSWIAVAQTACFGSVPGGMPAAQGWMMLVLAPLLLLAALVTAFAGELLRDVPVALGRTGGRAIALALLAVFAVEGAWAIARVREERRVAAVSFAPTLGEPLPRDYPRGDTPLPAFALVDQAGAPFTLAMLTGRPTVMSFVFAHCQTVCPALARTLRAAAQELGPDDARLALVTLDPWRDTPASLPGLAARWSLPAGTVMVSGPPDDVCRALDALAVARERDLRTGDVSHAPIVLIIDGRGRIAYRFLNPPAEWIVEGVRRVRARA